MDANDAQQRKPVTKAMEMKSESIRRPLQPCIGTKVDAKHQNNRELQVSLQNVDDLEHGTISIPDEGDSCVSGDGCKQGIVLLSPHILSGYRIEHSPKDLVASIFTLHNETGNIWTHLCGGILYAYFWTTNILTVKGMTWVDFRFGQIMLLLGMTMFACSVLYHTMKDNWLDKNTTSYYLQFDFVGILLLLLSKGLFDAYFVFRHLPDEDEDISFGRFSVYAFVTICITAVVSIFVLRDEKWYLFAPLYLYIWGCSFGLHWYYIGLADPWSIDHSQPLLGVQGSQVEESIILRDTVHTRDQEHSADELICSEAFLHDYNVFSAWAFICGVLGCVVYVTQAPESIYPGRFDHFFSSHQIWHVLTALGPILSTFAGRALIQCQVEAVGNSAIGQDVPVVGPSDFN